MEYPTAILIESQYLGPISAYSAISNAEKVFIEKHEHFVKSSYRNRCHIAGPDGMLRLTIPVAGGKHQRRMMNEVRIDNSSRWKQKHWNSITSCYRKSPYFEFYEDQFKGVFDTRHDLLFEMNMELTLKILELIGIKREIQPTESFQKIPPKGTMDLRGQFKPSINSQLELRYRQVFEEKTGFLNDLSIVDLLFNVGPESKRIIALQ